MEHLGTYDAWAQALDAAADEAQARERTRQIRRQERRIAAFDLDERARRRFEYRMTRQRLDRREARKLAWSGVLLIAASSFGLGMLVAGIIR